MANDKAKPAEAAAGAAEAPKKSSMMKMGVMAAVVLVLEGGTVLATMKMTAGPKRAVAEEIVKAPEPEPKDVEVDLMKDVLPNNIGGRPFLYDLQIVAKVSEKNKDKAKELFTARDAETRDRIRTIVASSDPKSLEEPGLETLRRQIAYQLEQDLGKDGKDLVKEVLIPKCTPHAVPQY